MRRYYQQIYAIDVAVGMIREAVDQAGVADRTVIIYTSDNGFLCGSHGYGSKVLPYEEASRVPLIIFDPRHPNSGKQHRCDALTGNVDFHPTILEWAGVDLPPGIDGRSLLPLYDDPQSETHESLPLINVWGPEQVHSLAVVTKDWKYIYWPYAGKGFTATEEIYHTAEDPLELVNRATDPAPAKTLRQRYDATVADWKASAVDYHGYSRFGILFNRQLDWSTKQTMLRDLPR